MSKNKRPTPLPPGAGMREQSAPEAAAMASHAADLANAEATVADGMRSSAWSSARALYQQEATLWAGFFSARVEAGATLEHAAERADGMLAVWRKRWAP